MFITTKLQTSCLSSDIPCDLDAAALNAICISAPMFRRVPPPPGLAGQELGTLEILHK